MCGVLADDSSVLMNNAIIPQIDNSYAVNVVAASPTPIPRQRSATSPTVIALAVILPLVVLSAGVAACYRKRRQLSEWILYKACGCLPACQCAARKLIQRVCRRSCRQQECGSVACTRSQSLNFSRRVPGLMTRSCEVALCSLTAARKCVSMWTKGFQ